MPPACATNLRRLKDADRTPNGTPCSTAQARRAGQRFRRGGGDWDRWTRLLSSKWPCVLISVDAAAPGDMLRPKLVASRKEVPVVGTDRSSPLRSFPLLPPSPGCSRLLPSHHLHMHLKHHLDDAHSEHYTAGRHRRRHRGLRPGLLLRGFDRQHHNRRSRRSSRARRTP